MSVQLSPEAIGGMWVGARLKERLPRRMFERILRVDAVVDQRRFMTRFIIVRADGARLHLQHPEFDTADFRELRPGLTFMLPEEELARLVLFLSD